MASKTTTSMAAEATSENMAAQSDRIAKATEQMSGNMRTMGELNTSIGRRCHQYAKEQAEAIQTAYSELSTIASELSDPSDIAAFTERHNQYSRAVMRHTLTAGRLGADWVSDIARLVFDASINRVDDDAKK